MVEEQAVPIKSKAWAAFVGFCKSIWKNVIKPALKDLLSNVINKASNKIIYGTDVTQNRQPAWAYPQNPNTGSNYPTRPAATGCYKSASPNSGVQFVSSFSQPAVEAVLKQIQSRINISGACSLAEMYTMARLQSSPSDCNVGWESANGFRVKYNPGTNDYTLECPDIVQL